MAKLWITSSFNKYLSSVDYLLSTVLEAGKRKAYSCPQGTRDLVQEMDAREKIVRCSDETQDRGEPRMETQEEQ